MNASLLTLVPPLLAGVGAVYLLLPRPRPVPAWPGVVLAVVALVLAGVLLVPAVGPWPEAVLFYAFSALALICGGLLVTQRNPARAAIAFAVVVLSVCGLFLLLAAPFLMAATVIIYAGAIVVTFLFILMLAQQEGPSDADDRSREPLLASITGFLLLGVLAYVLNQTYGADDIEHLVVRTEAARTYDGKAEIERVVAGSDAGGGLFRAWKDLLDARGLPELKRRVEAEESGWLLDADAAAHKARLDQLIVLGAEARQRLAVLQPPRNLPLSPLSGPPANIPLSSVAGPPANEDRANHLRRDAAGWPVLPAQNAAYLGRSLFSDYLLAVELAGTLLLVATIGAIAIAHRRTGAARTGRAT
jgi:NADH:ubiquinone oxidoreductase subunit 6 (subunit J)